MEKLMNILKPGKAQDDETLYGSGQQSGTTGNAGHLAGEGSHLKDATQVSDTANTPTSGVSGQQTSGPHSSNIENKLDPRVDSDNSRATGSTAVPSNTTSTRSNMPGGWNNEDTTSGSAGVPQSNTSSGHHLGRDAAAVGTAGAVGEGIHHHDQQQTNLPIRGNENTTSSSIAHPGTSQLESSPAYNSSQGASTTSSQYPNTTQGSPGIGSTATSQRTTSSGHHLGRDAAAIGTAGAVGEGIHHHDEKDRQFPLSSTTGPSTASSGYSGPGVSQTSHHTGPTGTAIGSSGPHNTNIANLLDPAVNTRGPQEDALKHSKGHGGGAEAADHDHGASGQSASSGHHYGRDAAVAGGAGAAAYGAEHHKHDKDLTQAERDAKREHKHELKEEKKHHREEKDHHLGRDAGVGAGALGAGGLAEHEHNKHQSTGATQSASNPTSSSHHYGRDAGIGAGGLGAAGLAEHEHHNRESTSGSTANTSGLPGPAPNTAGPHSKDWMNKIDPRVHAQPDPNSGADAFAAVHHPNDKNLSESERVQQKHQNDHHLGRDAAVAGGVGAGAYGAEHYKHDKDLTQAERDAKREHKHELKEEKKHHKEEKDHHLGRDAVVAGGIGGTAYEADKHHKHHDLDRNLGQSGQSGYTGTSSSTDPNVARGNEHHYGRDAGVAGVGAGAYEAEQHHKHDKDLTAAEKEAKKQHKAEEKEYKHEAKEAKKEQKYEQKEEKKEEKAVAKEQKHEQKEEKKEEKAVAKEHKPSLISRLLHRDKSKKYTKEEEDEFDRQDREHSSHTGRDAALGAGAAGAAGYGVHEHDKHSGATSLGDKPAGSDLGDKLHGTDRNRGVTGASGFAGSEGYGSGPQGVHSEATTDQDGNPVGGGLASGSSTTGTGHHYGRDAALAGGAGGLAEHEHHKHESSAQQSTDAPHQSVVGKIFGGNPHPEFVGHADETEGSDHHYGRDAAVAGGAGGLAEHEHRKHESRYPQGTEHQGKTTSITPSTTGIYEGRTADSSVPSSGLSSSAQPGSGDFDPYSTANTSSVVGAGAPPAVTGSRVVEGEDGHHRLHKDPPASHPAAQSGLSGSSHVPSSGTERENLIGQGRESLGDSTGVANSQGTGKDPLRNY